MGYRQVPVEYGSNLVKTLRKEGGVEKVAAAFSRMLRKQIYEDSFLDQIVPPKPITADDCDLDPKHVGGGQIVIHREFTNVRAIQVGYRGLADANYVETDGFAVRGFKIETDTQKMREGEIRHLRIPFKDQVQRQCIFQLSKQKDAYFIAQCEMALDDNPEQRIDSPNSSVTLSDLVRLKNVLLSRAEQDGLYLTPRVFLMTEVQFNNLTRLIQNNDYGGAGSGAGMSGGITEEFWKDGYTYKQIAGCRIVTTKKVDLFPTNRIYCFPDPDFIGYNFTFNQSRFMMKRDWDLYEFKAIDDLWFAIGNTYAVASLELREETIL